MKVRIATIFLMLMIFTTGCSTNEIINTENEKKDNNVEFNDKNTQVKEDKKDGQYKKLYGKIIDFRDRLNPNDFSWDSEKYTKDIGEEEGEVYYQGNKGSVIAIAPGYVTYISKEFNDYDSLFWKDNGVFRDDWDEITKNVKAISGITAEEAISEIKKIIDKYKINVGNIKAYPLSREVLKKLSRDSMSDDEYREYLKDKTNKPMKREFTEKDEMYLVVMEPVVGDYTLYNEEYDYGKVAYNGSIVYGMFMKDKMINFYADGLYETDENETKIKKMLTIDEAKKSLEDKYKDMILSNSIVCQNTEIKYIAVQKGKNNSFEFIPAYVFEMKYTITDIKGNNKSKASNVTQKVLLDAENGKWIE